MLDITKEDTVTHGAVRDEVKALLEREGLTQKQIATESGIAYGTLTPFLGGTYKGDNARIAEELQRWLETRKERARTATVLPKAPAFVQTPTSDDIFAVLSFAQNAPDFAVVVGGAGIGKTTSIEEYQRRASNVFIVTGEPSLATPHNLLAAISEEVGAMTQRSDRLSRAIISKLRGTGALVVIDEAQHLNSAALDQLRTTVYDRAGCGVVVSGNESVYTRLQGAGEARSAQFAQLHSRVGMRKTQPAAKARDICLILDAWKVEDEACRSLLKVIGRKPGALRGMTKTIRLAHMIAGGEPITAEQIRRAWSQLSSTSLES